MEQTLKKYYIILLVRLCFVHDLLSEVVSYTMYSIEQYVD